jgi:hypothetical protein
MSTEAAGAVQHPLSVVLQHLSSDDGDNRLYRSTARGLHRTCKQYQSLARATLHRLRLDRCYHLWLASSKHRRLGGFPGRWDVPVSPAPLELLAACPSVTTLTLHPEQLVVLDDGAAQLLEAAAGQLQRLEITSGALQALQITQAPSCHTQAPPLCTLDHAWACAGC